MGYTLLSGGSTATTDPNALVTGEEIFARQLATNNNLGMTSGVMRLTYFTCRKAQSATQVRVAVGGTAAAATPTLIRFGLYTVDGSGNGTLVAATPNDTSLLNGVSTNYTKALSAPYTMVAGQRYAFAGLVVSGVTVPALCGLAMNIGSDPNQPPRLSAALTGQTDLPASFTDASLNTTGSSIYAVILP